MERLEVECCDVVATHDTAIEKVVEWSKCWINGEDVRQCMDKQIEEFLNK